MEERSVWTIEMMPDDLWKAKVVEKERRDLITPATLRGLRSIWCVTATQIRN
jgi:uncharacterized membrane protein